MFEQFVSDLLVRYLHLDDYIEGIDSNHLNIALWNGDVTLENLKLRKESLNKLDLPVFVKGGSIGKLQMKIPWHKLQNEPIILIFEKLYLIVGPKVLSELTMEEIEKREIQKKKNQLELAEIWKNEQQQQAKEKQQGTMGAWITKIVDNIQITIKDVHMRYEDEVTDPKHPFTFGITLEHLSAVSTNEKWTRTFLTMEHKLIHKLVSLKNLSIYWNPNEGPLKFESLEDMGKQLQNLIYKIEKERENSNSNSSRYILSPVCGSLKVILNKSSIPDKQTPKYTFNFEFDEIGLALEDQQYRQLLELLDWFTFYSKTEQYRKFPRPKERPTENPRAWWDFAKTCVYSNFKKKLTKEYITQRRQMRLEYINLYRSKLKIQIKKSVKQDPKEISRIEELERNLSVEDILYFRALAGSSDLRSNDNNNNNTQTPRSWSSMLSPWYWTGSDASPQLSQSTLTRSLSDLTPEQKQDVFSSLEYTSAQGFPNGASDREYVKMVVNFSMKAGSVTLRTTEGMLDIVSATFNQFYLALKNRNNSMTLNASLYSLKVFDRYTPNTVFSSLISPLQADNEGNKEPFFSMLFEQNPLDSEIDYRLNLQMLPLEIVLNKLLIANIRKFFSSASESTTLLELEHAAQKHLKQLRSKTASKFVEELENHKMIELNINISAPKLLVPETLTDENTPIVVLDLGNLLIRSTPKYDLFENGNTSEEKHMNHSQREFYDRFSISLTSMQILMTTKAEHKVKHPTQLVEKFDIHVGVYHCFKMDVLLTRLKVYADLPSLQISLSRDKIIKILRIIAALVGNSEPQSEPSNKDQRASLVLSRKEEEGTAPSGVQKLIVDSKLIECVFSVPKVTATLMEDTNADLIKLAILDLGFHFTRRSFDMTVFVCLQRFVIEDCTQSDLAFKYIATSDIESANGKAEVYSPTIQSPQDYMIQGAFQMINSDSPEYSNVDMTLDVYFNTLHMMFNREPIVKLLDFAQHLTSVAANLFTSSTPPTTEAPTTQRANTYLKVTANMQTLDLTLNKEGVKLSSIALSNSSFILEMLPTPDPRDKEGFIVKAKGTLGNILMKDLMFVEEGSRYADIFGTTGDHMVEFSYETYGELSSPGYDSLLRLRMNSVRFTYLQIFFSEMADYFRKFKILHDAISSSTASLATKAEGAVIAVPSKKRNFIVEIANPQVVIPKSSTSSDLLLVNLGSISLYNKFVLSGDLTNTLLEKTSISISAMNLISELEKHTGGMEANKIRRKVVDDISIYVEIERPVKQFLPMKRAHNMPDVKINGDISNISIKLTEKEYDLILGVIRHSSRSSSQPESSTKVKGHTRTGSTSQTNDSLQLKTHISFGIQEISLELFRGDGSDLPSIQQPDSVVSFHVSDMHLILLRSQDESLKADFSLSSVQLTDTRPLSTNKFKQLLGPIGNAGGLLRIHYKQQPSGGKALSIHLDRPKGVVVMEAIRAIIDFLVPGYKAFVNNEAKKKTKEEKARNQSSFELRVNITNPEICFPEDASKANSKAIVGNTTFLIKYFINEQHKDLKVFVKKLQLYKCFLNQQSETAVSILEPFDFSVNWSRANNQPPELIAVLETMHITFSYRDFVLLKTIINSFRKQSTDEEISTGKQEITEGAPKTPKKRFTKKMIFKSGGLQLTLIDDFKEQSQNIPLVDIKVSELGVETGNGAISVGGNLKADYYNMKIAMWEPVIEEWNCQFVVEFPVNSGQKYIVRGMDKLNINLTKPFFETVLNTVHILKEDIIKNRVAQESPYRPAFHPFYIHNQTGQKLRYWFSNTEKSKFYHELDTGEEEPLQVPALHNIKSREIIETTETTLAIQILPWNPILNLPITRVGTYLLPLTPKIKDINPKVIYEISFREGSKVLNFRSNVVIKNLTELPLDVKFDLDHQRSHVLKNPVAPKDSRSVPIEYASTSSVQFRPASHVATLLSPSKSQYYGWSENSELMSQIVPGNRMYKCPFNPSKSFYYLLRAAGDKEDINSSDQFTITLLPPMMIENLLATDLMYKVVEKNTDDMQKQGKLESGAEAPVHEVDVTKSPLLKIWISGYEWSSSVSIEPNSDPAILTLLDSHKRTLSISAQMSYSSEGVLVISIYCRYWFINRTGHRLLFRETTLQNFGKGKLAAGQGVKFGEISDVSSCH